MRSIGLAKVELYNLERNAETLERIVYNDLKALESLPDHRVEQYEPRVWKKLEKLDELQEAIDAAKAELKESGAYMPVNYSGLVYEYKRPAPAIEDKPKKPRNRQAKTAWDRFAEHIAEDGTFTVADISRVLDTDIEACRSKIKHWRVKGHIEPTGKREGLSRIYRSLANTN